MNKWDSRFFSLATQVAEWSKDPERKVGAILVKDRCRFSVGYNGFPPGVEDDIRRLSDKVLKRQLTNHAEVNAVLNAAKNQFSTAGCTLYVTYHPCHNCATMLIGAGITRVVCPPPIPLGSWRESQLLASDILCEADVLTLYWNDAISTND
ncbi:deoxycytidylate deaminase [Synechococcus phage S-CBWM1]|uniref:Deoxycytidylate deaminase n=1 Tax=Synechococcus phage S-CBWM1 TaxID=2053653 RepID=A0A3G1L3R0_9CAUD|nr:deoxycytidylate deaminase [Synechococcus phage S-CBWM1]ATW62824.1 deoxycytidylate deaminase [Synechococcus phage S-CBWM1]